MHLKALRKAQNLTQSELADKAEITRSIIAKAEIGLITPSAATLVKLAHALNCTIDELLGNDKGRENPHEQSR